MTDIRIKFILQGEFYDSLCEGSCHRKTLPYLSLVQAVDGDYEIGLNGGELFHTGPRGFFITPAFARQTIIHHVGARSGMMSARWLFFDAALNGTDRLENHYSFPTVLSADEAPDLCDAMDSFFSSGDDFDKTCRLYDAVRLLVRHAEPVETVNNEFSQTVTAFISGHYREKIGVRELAASVYMSESNFYCAFRKHFGISPIAYLNQYRITLAMKMISETDMPVCRIAERVGLDDATYFNRIFRKSTGTTPTKYRTLFNSN